MHSEPFVSVVTPVYNGELYISHCIESVLNQTYQNFEYIIVNNCSTDSTFDIAKSYAVKDSRIKLHNNLIFLSALENQNFSLTLISQVSKYCKVVHADDLLFPECISEMVKVAEIEATIGIVSSLMMIGSSISYDNIPMPNDISSTQYPFHIFNGSDAILLDLNKTYSSSLFGNPSTLLIRSNLIFESLGNFYDVNHFFMDKDACYRILQKHKFAFIYQILSHMGISHDQVHSPMNKINAHLGANLYLLKKYGLNYFDHDEYKFLLNRKHKEYINFIKYNSLRRFRYNNNQFFWDFHLKYLNLTGYSLNKFNLLYFALLELFKLILAPIRTFNLIKNRLFNFFI
jgi:glycosyltransferase involved in cell wall biosynthesis